MAKIYTLPHIPAPSPLSTYNFKYNSHFAWLYIYIYIYIYIPSGSHCTLKHQSNFAWYFHNCSIAKKVSWSFVLFFEICINIFCSRLCLWYVLCHARALWRYPWGQVVGGECLI
jgi:hypothetical protein